MSDESDGLGRRACRGLRGSLSASPAAPAPAPSPRGLRRGLPAELPAPDGPSDPSVTLDAAQLALSGRLRLREGTSRAPEDVVEELWGAHFAPGPEEPGDGGDGGDRGEDRGKA